MIGDKRLTLGEWMQLRWGTYRRLYLNLFRPAYVRTRLTQRLGECQRCGACCQMLRRCVLLKNDQGLPACHLYLYRTPNCSRIWGIATSFRHTHPAGSAGHRRKSSGTPKIIGVPGGFHRRYCRPTKQVKFCASLRLFPTEKRLACRGQSCCTQCATPAERTGGVQLKDAPARTPRLPSANRCHLDAPGAEPVVNTER